jgi:hypothetical protein
MKKILSFLLVIVMTFAGCSDSMKYGVPPYDYPLDYSAASKSYAQDVLNLISKNDTRTLRTMFANTSRDYLLFNTHLSDIISFVEGEIVSHDKITASIEREGDSAGFVYISPTMTINNVKTSTGKTYDISYTSCLFALNNDDEEGIWILTVTEHNGKTLAVGQNPQVKEIAEESTTTNNSNTTTKKNSTSTNNSSTTTNNSSTTENNSSTSTNNSSTSKTVQTT